MFGIKQLQNDVSYLRDFIDNEYISLKEKVYNQAISNLDSNKLFNERLLETNKLFNERLITI